MKGRFIILLFSLSISVDVFAGSNELINAVVKKDCGLVTVEFEAGVSPNTSFKDFRNTNEIPLIFVSTANTDECTTRELIKHGANIDHQIILGRSEKDMFRATPLISAIRFNRDTSVELILKFNPNLDPKGPNGESLMDHPLIFPESFVTSRTKRIEQLLNDHNKI